MWFHQWIDFDFSASLEKCHEYPFSWFYSYFTGCCFTVFFAASSSCPALKHWQGLSSLSHLPSLPSSSFIWSMSLNINYVQTTFLLTCPCAPDNEGPTVYLLCPLGRSRNISNFWFNTIYSVLNLVLAHSMCIKRVFVCMFMCGKK